jgi:hypothetical protein
MPVTRGKNPVTLHLFIDCAYHAHTIPQILHEMDKINARFDSETLERLVLRFGNVYGSAGVHALHDADLIDEKLKDKTLNSLAGHSVSEPCGCEPFISLQAAMYNR